MNKLFTKAKELLSLCSTSAPTSVRVDNKPEPKHEPKPIPFTNRTKKELDKAQYFQAECFKNQIVLHHTVSPSGSVSGDWAWWNKTKERVATALIINNQGEIYEVFQTDLQSAHHLYIHSKYNKIDQKYKERDHNAYLNFLSIGIELDSAGGLKRKNGQWWSSFGTVIPDENVEEYPKGFRGYYGFERYSHKQIQSLKEVLLEMKYWYPNIFKGWRYDASMWDISNKALQGARGIWSHVSYRTDKSDCHPQLELIEMLKEIEREIIREENENEEV